VNFQHATLWLGRDRARLVHFEPQCFPVRRFMRTIELRAPGGRAASDGVRLFEAVCRELNDIPQLLLTGTPDAIAAFERHASAQVPGIARRIIDVQSVVKPTSRRLAALARWHFTAPPTCADVTA
jgi:hypothetical protein